MKVKKQNNCISRTTQHINTRPALLRWQGPVDSSSVSLVGLMCTVNIRHAAGCPCSSQWYKTLAQRCLRKETGSGIQKYIILAECNWELTLELHILAVQYIGLHLPFCGITEYLCCIVSV